MQLTKHFLGEYIELLDARNSELKYGVEDVRGINNLKKMIQTKADMSGRKLDNFYVVFPGEFVFNHRTSRNGSKFSITYNYEDRPYIFTEDYVVFKIKDECTNLLLTEWLYMFFCRPEFDRYVITNSWGSSTEFYNWEDLCEVELIIPDIEIQRKYAAIYNSMVKNQLGYESGLDDLKIVFESLLDKYKHIAAKKCVGEIMEEVDVRNDDGAISSVEGINITKQFMPSIADTSNANLNRYKVVSKNQFAYSGMQTGRDKCIRLALLSQDTTIIVSPAYTVLKIKDITVLPEYIMMWFSRTEEDRLGWFMSDASIRANLDLNRFFEIEVPIPSYEQQLEIVEIYKSYIERRKINEILKDKITELCPILIKGSTEEAKA